MVLARHRLSRYDKFLDGDATIRTTLVENLPSAKVLIVDDEERNRKLLSVFVQADGHSAIFAANGKEGVAAAIEQQPNLILLDLMMPDMDGFDVVRALKNNPQTRNIPIIVVTALNDVASHRRMLASGADEFIGKPVDRWELSLRIFKLLDMERDAQTPSSGSPVDGKKSE
jgi:CheY-like chemotaxis protein